MNRHCYFILLRGGPAVLGSKAENDALAEYARRDYPEQQRLPIFAGYLDQPDGWVETESTFRIREDSAS